MQNIFYNVAACLEAVHNNRPVTEIYHASSVAIKIMSVDVQMYKKLHSKWLAAGK